MDPLTLAVGVGTAAAATVGAGLRLRRRLRRAEATAADLRRELAAEQFAADHDCLTGLANRRAFHRLGHRLVTDPGRPVRACVVVDLNSFKQINDTLGHAAGDEVLVTVARRLARCAGTGNVVARLGGDEFAGLFTHPADDWSLLYPAVERLAEALAAPMRVAGRRVRVTAAVGAAAVDPALGLATALRRADSAMYRAKATGNLAACFNPVLDDDPGSGAWPSVHTREPTGSSAHSSASASGPGASLAGWPRSGATVDTIPSIPSPVRPAASPLPSRRRPVTRMPVDAARPRGAW